MVRKKIVSAILGAGFLAAFVATPAMATDVSISGTVDMYLTSLSGGLTTQFSEAELKFKTKGETANGWKVKSELELEIGQGGKNDFELEEASVTVDMGMVAITGGILEDWGTNLGDIVVYSTKGLDSKIAGSDESAAFRIAFGLMEELDLNVKLRYNGKGNSETRIQAKYDFGIGSVKISQVSAEVANVSETASDIEVALKFGALTPWVEAVSEGTKSQTILGANYGVSNAITVSGYLISQTNGSASDTETFVGAAYSAEPAKFTIGVLSQTGDTWDESGVELGMLYTF